MKNLIYFLQIGLFLLFSSCSQEDAIAVQNDTGTGGSYARSIISEDKLYIIDNTSIKTFSLANPALPEQIDVKTIGQAIESLFQLENKLFIGSGSGLYIYEINAQGIPEFKGLGDYNLPFLPCDPVVATPEHAFVTLNTLRAESSCGRVTFTQVNELRIFDIQDITTPQLIANYPMYNPKGVGIDGNTLFLCDDEEGLKIYDVTDKTDIQLIQHFDHFTAYDVIPLNGLLLLVATDNIYQFDYNDLNNIQEISHIPI